MLSISTAYGTTRPAQIAAKLATLQARIVPLAAPVEATENALEIERQDYAARMNAHQIERAELRIQRAELREFQPSADVCAEIARIETRLSDLDDYLIFEPDCDFEATPWPDQYDEFDADLPDELDGSFSYSLAAQ